MLLEGIFAPVTTPFYSDERVYFRKIEANMARYSRSLLAGMVVLGSTGEAVALNDEETRDVLRASAEATAPEKVLIAGVGRESVHATLELAEFAATLNYDAVLVRPPSYYGGQISPAAVLHYFRSIADRSALPVVLYYIPKFVPCEMPVELIAELAQHPNIIGIKDSSGNVERIRETVAATQGAPRHMVPVTQVFEAATTRMMLAPQMAGDSTYVSASDLAGGLAVASAPPAVPLRTRSREVGFQVLTGSERSILRGARGRRFRRHRRLCHLRPAGYPGDLPRLERSRPQTCRREATTDPCRGEWNYRRDGPGGDQIRLRLQRVLRR